MSIRVLPPPGAPRALAAAQLSNSVGDGAYYVSSALYFTRVVGLSPTQIGLGLTVAWADHDDGGQHIEQRQKGQD
ncbi:hypothetical protein ABZ366_20035, partial [Streptomyces sp. NPDC005904]